MNHVSPRRGLSFLGVAVADLDACVKAVLCGLSKPVVDGINAIITGSVAVLNGELVQVEAQLIVLEVATAPLEAAAVIATNTLNGIKAIVSLLPVQAVAGCVDLGMGVGNLNAALDAVSADAQNILEDLNRQLGAVAVLNAAKADIQAAVAFLNSIQLVITECT